MKKFTVLLSIVVLIFFFTAGSSHCQTTTDKNKPFFTIDVSGGLNIPLLDLKGSGPSDFYHFTNYGVDIGPSASVRVKMAVLTRKMLQLRLYFIGGYAHFSNTGNALNMVAVPLGWPKGFTPRDTSGTGYIRFNQPYGGLGFEYAQYTDVEGRSSFNFGLDVIMSWNAGRIYPYEDAPPEVFSTLHANLRLGLGLNIFWNYRFNNTIGMNLGSRFQFSNLIGKNSAVTDETGWMFLNDEANQSINANISNNRNVAFVGFFGGMSFYFGKR